MSAHVRRSTDQLMKRWRNEGRNDEEIEDVVRSAVLNAYVEGAKDLHDEIGELVRTAWRSAR